MASPPRKAKSPAMPGIPEERVGLDGRPMSTASTSTRWSEDKSKRKITSTVSEIPASYSSPEDDTIVEAYGNIGIAIPRDVSERTAFGPSKEYAAVPSILEYYTSKGRNKISVREATPEEAKEAQGRDLPIVTDIPQLAQEYSARDMPYETATRPRVPSARPTSRPPARGPGPARQGS